MATTPRYGFAYLDDLEPMVNTRAKLQTNAETAEAALARIDAYVDQLATVIPGGQTLSASTPTACPISTPPDR
jgi:hypothetical protein